MTDAVKVEDLVGTVEIAQRMGVRDHNVVNNWRRRHADFPAPVAELRQGRLWAWPDVAAWALKTGRRPAPPVGTPPTRSPSPRLDLALDNTDMAKRRVTIFTAGCEVCHQAVRRVQEQIDPEHDLVILDVHRDEGAGREAVALGVQAIPALVVDGALMRCCGNEDFPSAALRSAGLVRSMNDTGYHR